jgi:ankyrin repeat protein
MEALIKCNLVNVNHELNRTYLHHAIMKKKDKSTIFLLKNGAKVEIDSDHEFSTLHATAANYSVYNLELTKRLVADKNIDVNKPEKLRRNTPLIYASVHGNIEAMKVLLANKNIDVNYQKEAGETALHKAVKANKIEAVKLLLEDSRTDRNIKDGKEGSGMTALEYAKNENKTEIMKLFEEKENKCILFSNSANNAVVYAAPVLPGETAVLTTTTTNRSATPPKL